MASPTRATGSAPRRSAARPAPGAMTASTPAAAKKVAPSARPPAPRAARRSGARTSSTPKAAAGSAVSHMPASIERWRSAAAGAVRTSEPGGAGMVSAHAPRATPKRTVVEKAASRPMAVASAPTTGPSWTPKMAAPRTPPMTSPRRSRGASPATHAIPPAHVHAPPTPCMKRARSTTTIDEPNAKARPLNDMSVRPASTVALTPTRAASQPPGSAPISVPAA